MTEFFFNFYKIKRIAPHNFLNVKWYIQKLFDRNKMAAAKNGHHIWLNWPYGHTT